MNLHHPEWGEIDLHWRFGRNPVAELDPTRIFARSEWQRLFGYRIRVIGPLDGLVLSAHHAVRENFNPATMLRDVIDTKRWLQRLEEHGDSAAVLSHVERCRMAAPVGALIALLGHGGVLKCLGETAASGDLASLFQTQLAGTVINRDLQRFADPREWQKILRYGFGGVAGYQRMMNVHAPGQRVPWGERFNRLVRILASLRPTRWQRWRAFRTIGRVKANYQDNLNH